MVRNGPERSHLIVSHLIDGLDKERTVLADSLDGNVEGFFFIFRYVVPHEPDRVYTIILRDGANNGRLWLTRAGQIGIDGAFAQSENI